MNSRGWSVAEPPDYDAKMPLSRVAAIQTAWEHVMPNTYTQLMFHVVFSTKDRERTLTDGHRDALYMYILGIHNNLSCHLYRIGGVNDHVHILTGLPTTLSLAKYIQEIKAGSSHWLKSQAEFPRFESWQERLWGIHGVLSRQGPCDRIYQGPNGVSSAGIVR
jgi:REP element-mobilizing transposase RayT